MPEFWPLERHLGILRGSSEEEMFRELLETGLVCLRAEEGSILLVDSTAGDLVFAMTAGSKASEDTLRGQRVPMGSGISGLAAVTKQPQIGNPVYRDIQQSEIRSDSPNSVVAAPMILRGSTLGVMTAVTFDRARTFTLDDARILQRIANVAALVIDQRSRLASASGEKLADPNSVAGRLVSLNKEILGAVADVVDDDPQRAETVSQLLQTLKTLTSRKRR